MRNNAKNASFFFITIFVTIATLLCIHFLSTSHAEIYRWVDKNGVVHYTDNLMNVPDQYKNRAEKPDLPQINTYEEPSPASTLKSEEETENKTEAKKIDPDEIRKEIEILKTQIEAKKELIRSVDNKRNLALNPYRNRIISEEDLKLYKKYKKELPQDEKRLQELMKILEEGPEKAEEPAGEEE